jgi:hypothetical protein
MAGDHKHASYERLNSNREFIYEHLVLIGRTQSNVRLGSSIRI